MRPVHASVSLWFFFLYIKTTKLQRTQIERSNVLRKHRREIVFVLDICALHVVQLLGKIDFPYSDVQTIHLRI